MPPVMRRADNFDHPNVYNADCMPLIPEPGLRRRWPPVPSGRPRIWAAVAAHCNYANSTPVNYGYGDNVTYQNGTVFVDGQSVGTGEEFSQQAADLALAGHNAEAADSDEWLPLGVFALVRNEDQHPQITLQMAINQNGVLRGNYTDVVSDPRPADSRVPSIRRRSAPPGSSAKPELLMEAGLKT